MAAAKLPAAYSVSTDFLQQLSPETFFSRGTNQVSNPLARLLQSPIETRILLCLQHHLRKPLRIPHREVSRVIVTQQTLHSGNPGR